MKRFFALTTLALFVVALLASFQQTLAAGANLIANPSVETAAGTLPANWATGKWGTNTATFTYSATGHTGSKSLTVNMTQHTSGSFTGHRQRTAAL